MPQQMKRPVYPKFNTPKLVLKFPKIHAPDYGSKNIPKPDGEFSTKAIGMMDDPAVRAFIAKLQPHYDAAMDAAAEEFKALKAESRKKLGSVKPNPMFVELLDQDTEQPTGEVEFSFKRPYSGEYKSGTKAGQRWTATVPVFDAKGHEMKIVPEIWGGTVAIIAVEARPYFIPGTAAAGLKLALQGVQIIDLVSKGGARSAKSLGFGEEEGYEHEEAEEEAPAAVAGQEIGADDADF
jgi:hypothetical protein